MQTLSLSKMHHSQIEQITGCRYASIMWIASQVKASLFQNRLGRPYKHGSLTMTVLALFQMRTALPLRTISALTGIDTTTIHRCIKRVLSVLEQLPLAKRRGGFLTVDTTSIRVATTSIDAYSGHKHQRCAKVQVLGDTDGNILNVSQSYVGSAHDKTVWNKEFDRLKPLLDRLVLSDKAYAGAKAEKENIMRPLKRGESDYKSDKESAKEFNRGLSKKRVTVEHIFARLKTFKVLSGIFPFKWQRLGEVVRDLAVVHNANRESKMTPG